MESIIQSCMYVWISLTQYFKNGGYETMIKRELLIECIPQITEMALEIQKMTPEQYLEFKQEHLTEVERTYPVA